MAKFTELAAACFSFIGWGGAYFPVRTIHFKHEFMLWRFNGQRMNEMNEINENKHYPMVY